jgi:hypothetical protein
MNGLLACLTAIAGFILGVRVGLALARREQEKKRAKAK